MSLVGPDPLPHGGQPDGEPTPLGAGTAQHPDDQFLDRATVRHVHPFRGAGQPGSRD